LKTFSDHDIRDDYQPRARRQWSTDFVAPWVSANARVLASRGANLLSSDA
jgi:hypothetical protein